MIQKILNNSLLPVLCLFIILFLNKNSQTTQQKITMPEIFSQSIVVSNYDSAIKEAKTHNRDILLVVEAKWCGYCKKFRKEVLTEKTIEDELNNYVICIIDYKENSQIIKKYNISKLPSYVLIDNEGNLIKEGYGYQTKNIFIKWLKNYKSPKTDL